MRRASCRSRSGLAIATHLAMCPAARARYRALRGGGRRAARRARAGGHGRGCLAAAGRRWLDDAAGGRAATAAGRSVPTSLPRPLRDYLPGPLDSLRWRNLGDRGRDRAAHPGAGLPDDPDPRPRRPDGPAAHARGQRAHRRASTAPSTTRPATMSAAISRSPTPRSTTARSPTRARIACASP